MDALALLYDKIEFKSALYDSGPIDLNGPADPNTSKLMNWLRPSIVLTGNAGTYKIEPYGPPGDETGPLKLALGLGAAGLVGWLLLRRKRGR